MGGPLGQFTCRHRTGDAIALTAIRSEDRRRLDQAFVLEPFDRYRNGQVMGQPRQMIDEAQSAPRLFESAAHETLIDLDGIERHAVQSQE